MNVTTSPVNTNNLKWAVFVAQLVEGSLPTPEVRGSNPVIGKLYLYYLYSVNCFEKMKIKERGRERSN